MKRQYIKPTTEVIVIQDLCEQNATSGATIEGLPGDVSNIGNGTGPGTIEPGDGPSKGSSAKGNNTAFSGWDD